MQQQRGDQGLGKGQRGISRRRFLTGHYLPAHRQPRAQGIADLLERRIIRCRHQYRWQAVFIRWYWLNLDRCCSLCRLRRAR